MTKKEIIEMYKNKIEQTKVKLLKQKLELKIIKKEKNKTEKIKLRVSFLKNEIELYIYIIKECKKEINELKNSLNIL